MKIAIQGHPTRGKEVIQILKSLGGKNQKRLIGSKVSQYYFINYIGDIDVTIKFNLFNHKLYTLEEFEKEFPFKIDDEVIFPVKTGWASGIVTDLTYVEDQLKYEIDSRIGGYRYIEPHKLSLYPMKKERNITLTLDKAKEWYKKGGELREVALQAYSEEELTKVKLPKTWEEFCEDYSIKKEECYISVCSDILISPETDAGRDIEMDKNLCPSQKSAEAHLALIQLEQLRDCYRGLFVTVIGMPVWSIIRYKGTFLVVPRTWGTNEAFLSFQSPEIAREYLNNFKPLLKQAGDLIQCV